MGEEKDITPSAPHGFTSSQIEASAKGVSSGELAFAEKAKEIAGALKADTAEGYAVAADFAKGVKAQIKRLDDLRKEMKRPLKETGDKIDAYFKPPIEAYRRAEDAVKHAMLAARETAGLVDVVKKLVTDREVGDHWAEVAALRDEVLFADRLDAALDHQRSLNAAPEAEPTVTEAEERAATDTLRADLFPEDDTPIETWREAVRAALLAAAKVRAGGAK